MTPPTIVYLGNTWFSDNRTSSHHVARHLAARARVLYVECPGLRAPDATPRDASRIVRTLARALQPPKRLPDGLLLKTLVQWPVHASSRVARLNRAWSRVTVRRAMRVLGSDAPIAWCTVPHVAAFVGDLGARAIVYHCIDDYAALPGVDAATVRQMDDALARRADLVMAASTPVYESRRALNPRTVLMPHGVDFDHFARACTEALPSPPELVDVRGPIVGFIGLIERWIDVELVGWLARELPHVTFVMVGRVATSIAAVPAAPNLRWLGARPYERLPEYGARFDAAIIPYRLNEQVHAANPLKLREYLSMGLPVVSVSTPEIERFAHVVSIATTREAFRDALAAALAPRSDGVSAAQRQEAALGSTWAARVDDMWHSVQAVLDEKALAAA